MSNPDHDRKRGTAVKERQRTERPRLYKVIFHNDDFTSMEFVVEVLCRFFHHDETGATRIMLLIHHTGQGIAGTYSREIAETKVQQTIEYARDHQYPLKVTMEPE